MCVLALALGVLRRAYLPAAAILTAELVAVWLVSDGFKAIFRRARPDYFYSIHETSYSYASGHATLSLAAYGFIAYVVCRSALSRGFKGVVVFAAGVWTLAIGWSRLSLGAHYATDVIGGYLLATTSLTIAMELYDRASGSRRLVSPPLL